MSFEARARRWSERPITRPASAGDPGRTIGCRPWLTACDGASPISSARSTTPRTRPQLRGPWPRDRSGRECREPGSSPSWPARRAWLCWLPPSSGPTRSLQSPAARPTLTRSTRYKLVLYVALAVFVGVEGTLVTRSSATELDGTSGCPDPRKYAARDRVDARRCTDRRRPHGDHIHQARRDLSPPTRRVGSRDGRRPADTFPRVADRGERPAIHLALPLSERSPRLRADGRAHRDNRPAGHREYRRRSLLVDPAAGRQGRPSRATPTTPGSASLGPGCSAANAPNSAAAPTQT